MVLPHDYPPSLFSRYLPPTPYTFPMSSSTSPCNYLVVRSSLHDDVHVYICDCGHICAHLRYYRCVCVCVHVLTSIYREVLSPPRWSPEYLAVLEDTSPTETDNEETQEEAAGETCALFIPVNKRITKRMLP